MVQRNQYSVRVLEVKFLGHASWKIETGGKVIYLDPYEGDYSEKADLILSTHHHDDHCKPDKVKEAAGDKTIIIAPEQCGEKLGVNVKSLKPGEGITIGNIKIEAVQAYNFKRFRSPGTPYHPKGIGVGYMVTAEGKTVYHTGDTDFIDEMKDLEDIDLMLVPSGGTYTMDNSEAADATIEINPKRCVPMHIWDTSPVEFKIKVESSCDTEVVILKLGDTITL